MMVLPHEEQVHITNRHVLKPPAVLRLHPALGSLAVFGLANTLCLSPLLSFFCFLWSLLQKLAGACQGGLGVLDASYTSWVPTLPFF